MADQQFFLKWNDFQTNMVTSFRHLRDEKSFTDVRVILTHDEILFWLLNILQVTLACEGQTCKAHKMVLSACSPYFKSLLEVSLCFFFGINKRKIKFEVNDLQKVRDSRSNTPGKSLKSLQNVRKKILWLLGKFFNNFEISHKKID